MGGALLMGLSKAFDTINHDLFIAKFHAYGFSNDSLQLLYSYLNNIWHRTKLNRNLVGPILFNIYLNDLFILSAFTDLCNLADDTTFYACDMDLNSLINRLEHDSFLAIEWFENNNMKLNRHLNLNYHFLVSGYKNENVWASIWNKKTGKVISRNRKV